MMAVVGRSWSIKSSNRRARPDAAAAPKLTLRERAYERTRDDTFEARLHAAEVLAEPWLAEVCGIGRTPIAQVASLRLVRRVSNGGPFVAELAPHDVIETNSLELTRQRDAPCALAVETPRRITRAARNGRLRRMLTVLENASRRLSRRTLRSPAPLETALAEDLERMEALEPSDGAGATDTLRRHLRTDREAAVSQFHRVTLA